MKKKLLNAVKILFFLGLGFFFIWLFLRNLTINEKKDIIISFQEANYWWILVSVGMGLISHTSRTLRWKMMLKPLGYNPRFINVFFAVLIGYFANLALPRLGEVSRCGVLARYEKIPFQKSFGTVFTERAIDLATFLILFFINLALQFKKVGGYINEKIYTPLAEKLNIENFSSFLLIVFLGALLIFFIFTFFLRKRIRHTKFYRKIKNIILGFGEGLKSLLKIDKPGLFIFHSVVIWLLYYLMTYVVFMCLPETSNLPLKAGLAVFVFATIGIMVVQGGIGIYPAIVAETLVIYMIPETKGYAMGWLLWTGQTMMIILAGIISLTLLPIINKTNNEET